MLDWVRRSRYLWRIKIFSVTILNRLIVTVKTRMRNHISTGNILNIQIWFFFHCAVENILCLRELWFLLLPHQEFMSSFFFIFFIKVPIYLPVNPESRSKRHSVDSCRIRCHFRNNIHLVEPSTLQNSAVRFIWIYASHMRLWCFCHDDTEK